MDIPGEKQLAMTSPRNADHNLLEQIYGIKFPPDFFSFWHFASNHPSILLEAEIHLTGPFDLLRNPVSDRQENLLWEARYYNDPPEFLTVASGHTDGLHWGYYVDDPESPPFPLVSYYSNDAFELQIVGYTMFDVLRCRIEELHQSLTDFIQDDPDSKESYQDGLTRLAPLRKGLQLYGTGDRLEIGQEYILKYQRDDTLRQPVASTRDYIGIVTPSDKYISLTADDIFNIWNISPTPSQVTLRAQEAKDLLAQGYPGAALKLGKDLWTFEDYRETSYTLLNAAYAALNRPLLQKFLQVAIEYRTDCDSRQGS